MKVRIQTAANQTEVEVVIFAPVDSHEDQSIKTLLEKVPSETKSLTFYQGTTKYYLKPSQILFFETDGRQIHAHTINDVYVTKHRLYELEEQLPNSFIRISKSAIINVDHVLSITRSISNCLVQFQNSHKQVYASRRYYKQLQERLNEMR